MGKIFPYILVFIVAIAIIYYFGGYALSAIAWVLARFADLLVWLAGLAWEVIKILFSLLASILGSLVGLIFEIYKSLAGAYPLLFLACLSAALALIWFFSLKPKWYFVALSAAPVIAAGIGEVLYGNISLNIHFTFSDAGLLFASIITLIGLYYVLIKTRIIRPNSADAGAVSKILNHSFVITLVLIVGAFGIALVDKLAPLIKT